MPFGKENCDMKWYSDGDHVFIVKDDFVDLQESSYVYTHEDSNYGKALRNGSILNLPISDLVFIRNLLNDGFCGGI